jgi:AraC-like DNA-binding protein
VIGLLCNLMPEMDGFNCEHRTDPLLRASGTVRAAAPEKRLQRILETAQSGSLTRIRDLACEFNLSASHLQHLFKAQTGSCLGRSLTEERLRRAAALLLDTNLSVKEVAYIVGYKHPSSFIRAFVRYFAQAPSCYRQTTEL